MCPCSRLGVQILYYTGSIWHLKIVTKCLFFLCYCTFSLKAKVRNEGGVRDTLQYFIRGGLAEGFGLLLLDERRAISRAWL